MPVRVVCSSCDTQLNVRDEHAGRPVKCPKCGSVIPPAVASDVPPPLPPQPAPPPLPTVEDTARPTAKPASTRPPRDRDADDDEDRPRRKRRRDDDDDDAPRSRREKKGSSAGPVLAVVGLLLLLCCGGGAFGIYYFVNKVQEKVEQAKEWVETVNVRVSRVNYERLREGMTTGEAENILGPGKIATAEQVEAAFPAVNRARAAEWKALARQSRVVIWRNGDDYLLGLFYPSAANGRLQAKTYQPGSGLNSAEQRFATDEEAAKPGWGKPKEPPPPIEIAGWNLAKIFKENPAEGQREYKGRSILLSGIIHDITLRDDSEVMVSLIYPPPVIPAETRILCVMRADAAKNAWRLSRGQTVAIRGTCEGGSGATVTLSESTIERPETDPAIQATLQSFVAEFSKNSEAAEKKYEGKTVWFTSVVVVKAEGNTLILNSPIKAKHTIRATFPPEFRRQIETLALKPGGRVSVKGEFSSFSDDEVSLNRCWLVP